VAAKLTRLTHEIAIRLHLVAESCTICSSRFRRPVRKLLVTPSRNAVRDKVHSPLHFLRGENLKVIKFHMSRCMRLIAKAVLSVTCLTRNIIPSKQTNKQTSFYAMWGVFLFPYVRTTDKTRRHLMLHLDATTTSTIRICCILLTISV
jgi:hypothetical protein